MEAERFGVGWVWTAVGGLSRVGLWVVGLNLELCESGRNSENRSVDRH